MIERPAGPLFGYWSVAIASPVTLVADAPTGYIRPTSATSRPAAEEVVIPPAQFERVLNMTRRQRRAWARAERERMDAIAEARRRAEQGGTP